MDLTMEKCLTKNKCLTISKGLYLAALSALTMQQSLPCAAAPAKQAKKPSYPSNFSGNASWYGIPFHGRKTASGEIFNMNKLTAAHLKLPFHTKVLVEDPKTGKSIIIKVNDRGPYAHGRVMDLAKEAARQLGTLPRGVAYIDCTVIDDDD